MNSPRSKRPPLPPSLPHSRRRPSRRSPSSPQHAPRCSGLPSPTRRFPELPSTPWRSRFPSDSSPGPGSSRIQPQPYARGRWTTGSGWLRATWYELKSSCTSSGIGRQALILYLVLLPMSIFHISIPMGVPFFLLSFCFLSSTMCVPIRFFLFPLVISYQRSVGIRSCNPSYYRLKGKVGKSAAEINDRIWMMGSIIGIHMRICMCFIYRLFWTTTLN